MAKRKTEPKENSAAFAKYTVTFPGGLNLREGPGKTFSVLRVLQHGEVVEAEGRSKNGWLPVSGGWVDRQYLEKIKEE